MNIPTTPGFRHLTASHLRDLADQAKAENESGVIAGDEAAQCFLDGVEQALRWAVGDGTTEEIRALVERHNAASG